MSEAETSLEAIDPAFRAGVMKTLEQMHHEARADARDLAILSVTEAGVSLSVVVDDGTITQAHHAGAPDPGTRAVLELVCRHAIGAPVQDVADHAVGQALEQLLDRSLPSPVPGILIPRNAGEMFRIPLALARMLWDDYRRHSGAEPMENMFERPLSAGWLALDGDTKSTRIKQAIETHATNSGLGPEDFVLSTLDEFDRIFVIIAETVPQDQRPTLLMRLETSIRQQLGERIEVFAEEAKDDNRIRRL